MNHIPDPAPVQEAGPVAGWKQETEEWQKKRSSVVLLHFSISLMVWLLCLPPAERKDNFSPWKSLTLSLPKYLCPISAGVKVLMH